MSKSSWSVAVARVVSALVAGDLHFSVGGGEGSVRSQLRGADTVIAASSLSKGLQRIMARPEIKNYQEPKVKERDVKSFVDESLVKQLEDSGFTKALYAR